MCALSLDGVDDVIKHGDIDAVDGSTALTVALWARLDSLAANGALCCKLSSAGSTAAPFAFRVEAGGGLTLELGAGASPAVRSSGGGVSTGAWTHLAAVFDGGQANSTARIRLYLDGSTVAQTFSGTVSTALVSDANEVTVGGDNRSPTDNLLDGQVALLKVWTASLSAAEIAAERLSHFPQRTDGLVLYAPYDDGVSARDYSGNDNGGTVTGATSTSGPPISPNSPIIIL